MDVVKNQSYGCHSGNHHGYGGYNYGSSSDGFAQTWYLGSACSYAKLYSPYTYFDGTGTITFNHKLNSKSGKERRLRAYLIDANGNLGQKIFDYTYITNYQNVHGDPTDAQTATIPVTWTGVYMVKWYWSGYKGCSRGIIDDIVIDGQYSTSPWCWCHPIIPQNPCTDSDGDGCCDSDDDFPNDPTKCTGYYVPGKDAYNTIAYEDLWPATGDFDFNDMVLDRYSEYGLNHDGDVVDVTHKIVVRAAGAGYYNGFGINMPGVAPSDVASVTGTMNNPGNYTTLNPNGTEANQSTAVVIGFENWKNTIHWTHMGAFYNTLPVTGGTGYSDTITIHIVFNSPQPMDDELLFDPFLIKNGGRSVEVHLPWFGPTDLVDLTKFDTKKDGSSTNAYGNHYVTTDNIPWAIYTPLESFRYPVEYTDITTVYNYFATWAASNGASYSDWYMDKPGYRDASKLYQNWKLTRSFIYKKSRQLAAFLFFKFNIYLIP